MAKQDYIPRSDTAFIAWHDNFKAQAAAIGASVGLVAADLTAINNHNADIHSKHAALVAAKAVQQAATADKKTTFKTRPTARGHSPIASKHTPPTRPRSASKWASSAPKTRI